VTFDSQGKIVQIRQSWDQGSLLKQVDVIGRTGRNWPIRDSTDQIKLIAKCIQSGGAPAVPTAAELVNRSRGNSNNILRDPHASLALFAPREEVDNAPASVISPYAGRRPRQRSFTEILGDEPVEEESGSPSKGRERSESPNKVIAPKIGAGKNFQPSRLFDRDENFESGPDTPERPTGRTMRAEPKKYQHFDFADGSDPQDAPKMGVEKPKTKHDSNWSFDDFMTPQKATATRTLHRARDVRHWGNDSDVVEETPAKYQPQVKGRREAEAHFEMVDDGGPSNEPRLIGRPRGTAQNTGLGLYENNLYNEDGSAPTPAGQAPLGNITNLKYRDKHFEAHFDMADVSPVGNGNGTKPAEKIGDDRKKAVRMMESNWSSYDQSPASQKENSNPNTGTTKKPHQESGISTAGDGMGGKKGAGRGWGIGDESDEEKNVPNVPGKKQAAGVKNENFWDF